MSIVVTARHPEPSLLLVVRRRQKRRLDKIAPPWPAAMAPAPSPHTGSRRSRGGDLDAARVGQA